MNRRVLVTRPQAQNASLVQALQQQGFTPLVLPLLEIDTYNEQEHKHACELIKTTVQHLDEYQHLVFVSTNAVAAAWTWIDRYWPQLPVRQHWYAIGEATAKVLQQHVPQVEQAGSTMDSESLLAHPQLQHVQNQKVLVFRGHGGRNHMREVLEQRGAVVDYCEVYQRQPVRYRQGELRQLLAQGIDLLTASSGETLQLLLEQATNDGIKEQIQKLPVVVPGQRVAGMAAASGFKTVIAANNASVAAMLNACVKQ